ncbi:MAG TPA: Smr/MutS family protein [Steroidobacteraceae bacterium]|nr:Smr/MutS family protein [Steroidobacteraceae bacterium]
MKPKPDAEGAALFRAATRGVKPLTHALPVSADAPKPRVRARFTRADRQAVLDEILHGAPDEPQISAADPSLFARPVVSATTLRKLRRGQYRVQAELDLHGLTQAQARLQLSEFLAAALAGNARCVRIVHGKGLRSGSKGPVLRQLVNGVLRRSAQVLAFASARQVDGGTGAVYVLLESGS